MKKDYDYEYTFHFQGFGPDVPAYPRWLYREDTEPILVENAEQEAEAREKGFDNITAAALSNRNVINWFWDLEDMSPKQLVVFAKDEFEIDLPIEAGQDALFKAVCRLSRDLARGGRMVLMAHEIEMKYDAMLDEIKRMASGDGQGLVTEYESEVFYG